MKSSISYSLSSPNELKVVLSMIKKLWKNSSEEELITMLKLSYSADNQQIWIAKNMDGDCIGFAIASIRTDYVEGAKKSPTGYLEGIFVEEPYRNKGIARGLLNLTEQWLKENNCTQMGSDTWVTHTASRNFHKKVGFWEEDVLVHFLKNL